MDDHTRVAELLGRTPRGEFDVVVRDEAGEPVVVRNAPFLDDGTPMPTRYYLVGADLVRQVSRLEAAGGVRRAEAAIAPDDVAATHQRYADERDGAVPPGHSGPRPSGGVGGTRTGVKCLHAHVAHSLAGGDDPVGRWALERLAEEGVVPHTVRVTETVGAATAATPPSVTVSGSAASTESAPGTVTIDIDDRVVTLRVTGGGSHELPIGPLALADGPLGHGDPPAPADLTNALGFVQDHVDDVVIAAPSIVAAPQIVAAGRHAAMLARVEVGLDEVPTPYELRREDADEVFRTLVVEPSHERRHNPGLDPAHLESIIGTCCVILGIMRRLDLQVISIDESSTREVAV